MQASITKYEQALRSKTQLTNINTDLLEAIAKSLGPSIYLKNASLVSSSNKNELETIKQNFLIQKLGLKDSPKLDEAIQNTINILGKSNNKKYRVIFYYVLLNLLDSTDIFIKNSNRTEKDSKISISSFSENFLNSQNNIDPEIRKVTEESIFDLLL